MEAATAARSLGTADGVRDAERLLEIQRQINAELRRSANLNQNRQYDQAQERLRRVQLLLQEQVFVEGRITDQVEIRNAARRQEELFLESSGGRAEQLSQGARDAAANVSVARQFRGQIASGAARIQISAEIDRVTNSIIELQRQMARVAASDLGFDERVAELDRLDNEIRQSTNGLAAFVADRSGGAFNTRQIEASMGRARNQSGSLSGTGVLTAQLAAQQALFAIDDFISSTGGFEYKIRAIGNNITQLGLLLGQSGLIAGLTATTGLFAGLAVVIGGQALSAIIKWYNAGVTAEDQAKALNDALQKQKSLAEELAASFESLGKSIADGAFSASAKSARDFALSLEEVAKKQQLLREEQFGALDPASVQQKSIATSIDKRLQAATDAGQIVALTQAQTRARVAARGAARTAAGRSPNFDDAISAVGAGTQNRAESNRRLLGAQLDYWGGGISSLFNGLGFAARLAGRANAPMPESQDLRRQRLEAARGDRVAERNAVQTEIDRLRPLAEQDIGLFTTLTGTSEAVANASREFSRLQLVLIALNESASQDDISRFFRSAREGGLALEAAQNQAAEAIRAGIPSALALSGYIDRLAGEIDAAQKEIAKAQQEFAQRGSAPTQADFDELNRQVSAAQARIDRGRAAREQAQARAAELEQRRIVDPQSTLDARRQRAEANLQASGAESGIIARRIRELEARRARAEAAVSQRPDSAFVRRRADREISAINEEMKAIEAATLGLKRFTEALARASAEAESNLQAARQRDDDIRRQSLAPGRGAALPTQAERDRARRNVEEQQVANRAVEQAVAQERDRLERLAQDPQNPLSETFRRLREIDEQLSSGAGTERERQRLIEERRSLQQRVDSQIDESPAVRAARDNSTRIEQRQTAEDRGRDLAMTPAQRAAREFGQQARDLTAEMNRINAPNAVRGANMSRLALEAAQQVAPMVMGFREERLNAALQGPSRAALNVADVNTMEGQRELNRLLRGDDANRDVNLVELQKQTEKLQEVVDAIRDQDRAAVVELRG
jgi:hypothetical protein